MILVGNQRGGARDLARHLMKEENDHVEVHEIRGFVANDLMGAFRETEMISRGTRCKQYLFSLSLNPPEQETVGIADFEKAIHQVEDRLGLTGQPRAVVFHEKEGRRHAHAVWSRIDCEKMKAVQLSHYKQKLCTLSKQLYLDHGWRLPPGHVDKKLSDPLNFTLEEWQQAKRTEQDPRDIKRRIREAWSVADMSGYSFAEQLEKHGYTLAQGNRRSHVAMSRFGEVYSIPRQLGLKTKVVREALGDADALPTIDVVKERNAKAVAQKLEGFITELDAQEAKQKQTFQIALKELRERQRAERKQLKERQEKRRQEEVVERQKRFRSGLKGVWDFVRGEHFRIARRNKLEAVEAAKRDRAEHTENVTRQLAQRRAMTKRHRKALSDSRRIDLNAEAQILRLQLQSHQKKNSKGLAL